MKPGVLVTAPPYAPFLAEVVAHPLVTGLRLNTVMPLHDGPRGALERLSALGSPLWVDLKGRQLRVVEAALPPFTSVRISHHVRLPLPADVFFSDGREHGRVVAIDGDRLILQDSPRRVVGPGESLNLVHPELEIEGTLTETDRAFLRAMAELGLRRVMLSYVESASDVEELRALLPDAEVICKIESRRGLAFADRHGPRHGRLMAARGDLYVELVEPHRVLGALARILRDDPDAVVASRLFSSLSEGDVPSCSDLCDYGFLRMLGYRSFMLGDDLCFRRESCLGALNLIQALEGELQPHRASPKAK